MLRRDTGKLGRVSDMLETDKELKRKRKAFDTDEGAVMGRDGEDDKGAGAGGNVGAGEGDGGKDGGKKEERKSKKKKKDKERREREGGEDASTVRSG